MINELAQRVFFVSSFLLFVGHFQSCVLLIWDKKPPWYCWFQRNFALEIYHDASTKDQRLLISIVLLRKCISQDYKNVLAKTTKVPTIDKCHNLARIDTFIANTLGA
jgi:hypothetical protein